MTTPIDDADRLPDEQRLAFPARRLAEHTDSPLPTRRAARGRGGSPRRVPAFELACRRADRALRQALRAPGDDD